MGVIKDVLTIIFWPKIWLMNDRYNKDWDKKLNSLMKANKFEQGSEYDATIGGTKVWIANHPYASFSPRSLGENIKVRPSRITILRAHRKLVSDLLA